MKKLNSLFLAILLILTAATACSGSDDRDANSSDTVDAPPTQSEQENNENNDDVLDFLPQDDTAATPDDVLHAGIYVVGRDFNEGQYWITCIDSEYMLKLVIFKSEIEYETYESSERFTVGEESRAIELHSFFNEWVGVNNVVYVGLETGMVMMVDNGIGHAQQIQGSPDIIHTGIYVVGKDIYEGCYLITCAESDYMLQTVLFDNEEKYGIYRTSERFTIGEENRAIELNSRFGTWVNVEETIYIRLDAGMVMKISNGIGHAERVENTLDKLYTGVYVVGDDIEAGQYLLTCIESDFSIRVVVFPDEENYGLYLSSERFTIGEENDALEKYSDLNEYIPVDTSMPVNLETGMVLKIENGIAQIDDEQE